jgi:hypothetical protein
MRFDQVSPWWWGGSWVALSEWGRASQAEHGAYVGTCQRRCQIVGMRRAQGRASRGHGGMKRGGVCGRAEAGAGAGAVYTVNLIVSREVGGHV